MLKNLHTIAFTHRTMTVTNIGLLHIEKEAQKERLSALKAIFNFEELYFLSTCNRVELTFLTKEKTKFSLTKELLKTLYPSFQEDQIDDFSNSAEYYSGTGAINHALSVAASIDSMIVGEREIITQVRTAYEHCRDIGLTGDVLRLLFRHVIETAKKVYTKTSIATKPVSVVSLAYHQLKKINLPLTARILVIGSGTTNTTMGRFLKKHGFRNFVIFNRTLNNAQVLAKELQCEAFALTELGNYTKGFELILSCTGADHHVISPSLYLNLLQGDTEKKTVIDIAIPQDLSPSIIEKYAVNHISVDFLQKISNQNLKERGKEVEHVIEIISVALEEFEFILKERSVEIAMKSVPNQVKEIKKNAVNAVFKDEIEGMDEHSKKVLKKVIGYMEKKYISGPMKLAKEIILKNAN